ncbi:MAG: GAF domain-containing protein [Lewinellaceae bacterium]|nr:GAF domain-containing protein [Lewinellaceae bacterium]
MEKIRILLIDDDPLSREGIVDDLEIKNEFEVHAFGSGPDAISHLTDHEDKYTAVLLDYVLDPFSMTGEEVLRELRHKFPSLPVIVFTGKDPSGGIYSLGQGAYAIMQRPLDYTELVKILRDLASLDTFFMKIAQDIRDILNFDVCLVWRLEKKTYEYKVIGYAGQIDKDYLENVTLPAGEISWQKKFEAYSPCFIENVRDPVRTPNYIRREEAIERGWTSLVSIPLIRDQRLLGLIDCYSLKPYQPDKKEKAFMLSWLEKYALQASEAFHASFLTQQLRVVHEINQNLASTLEVESILQSILFKTTELTGADFGWVYLSDAQSGQLKLEKSFGLNREQLDEIREPGEGITGWVAREGVAKHVPDVTKATDDYKPSLFLPTPGIDVRSEVAVPLRRGERTIGVITIKSQSPDFFTFDDIDLVISLAAIAAVAIERAKLTRHLNEISRLAQEATEFKKLSNYLVESVRDLTGADVNLWMMSSREGEGDNWMRIVGTSGNVSDDYIHNTRVPTLPGSCFNAEALHQKKPIIAPNLWDLDDKHQKPRFYHLETARKFGWKSFMAVPMIGQAGDKIGVISLYGKTEKKFDENDGHLIQIIGNQAALALQQQRRINAMQRLAGVGHNLATGRFEFREILKKVAQQACIITNADSAVIYPYDPAKQDFYKKEEIVDVGLRTKRKNAMNKPKKNGLAALVRKHEVIIIDDIDEMQIRAGLKERQALEPGLEEYDAICKRINNSRFIPRENFKAFVGISLKALEEGRGRNAQNQEVAVMYLNYRAPHHFSEEELQIIDIFSNQVANVIHRTRLYDKTKRQKEELEAVQLSAIHILAEHDLQKRLQGIVQAAVKLLKGKGGKIYLAKNSRKELELLAVKGIRKDKLAVGFVLPRGEGMAGWVVKNKKPLVVKDYAKWPGHIKSLAPIFSAVAEVPLLFGNDVIGVLGVFDDKETREFDQNDVDILERLASQAALAIKNIKLYDELDALYQTGINIARRVDLKELSGEILDQLRRVIEFEKATIQLIREEHSDRELLAFRGFDQSGVNPKLLGPVKDDVLIQKVIEKRTSKILSYTHRSSLWDKQIPETKDVHSWACVPLIYGKKILGLMTLDHHIPGYYQQKDKKHLIQFATQAAIAIQTALQIESLKKREKELKELDKRKSEFLSTVSHELRSPLTPIKSCLQLMLAGNYGPITDLQRSRLAIALAGVEDEEGIIKNLLDLVRIEENRISFDVENLDFHALAKKVIERFEYNARQKNIKLALEIPQSLMARLDKEKILSILANLIENGIKFTPEKGTVTVAASIEANLLTIKVSDTGIGISPAHQEKVFDKFYQVDSSLTRKAGGVGIGLSIVRKYVELHKGEIQVLSNIKEGFSIVITIPQ